MNNILIVGCGQDSIAITMVLLKMGLNVTYLSKKDLELVTGCGLFENKNFTYCDNDIYDKVSIKLIDTVVNMTGKHLKVKNVHIFKDNEICIVELKKIRDYKKIGWLDAA